MQNIKRKRIITIVSVLLALVLIGGSVGLYFLAVSIYDSSFNYRCTTAEADAFDIAEFPAMTRQRHTFTSNNGQTLVGYLYEQENTPAADIMPCRSVFCFRNSPPGKT